MHERYQRMSLAAAVLRPQPDDRGDFAAFARKPQAHRLEQLLHPARRVALGEKSPGIEIILRSRAVDHARKVGHELVIANSSGLYVVPQTAGGENCRQTHLDEMINLVYAFAGIEANRESGSYWAPSPTNSVRDQRRYAS